MATRTNKKLTVTEETIPTISEAPLSAAELRDKIAWRAYEIFLARNGAPGDELGDWLIAEHEISATYSAPITFADNVVSINSMATKRKRASTTQTTKAKTTGSSTSKSKTASAPRLRKRKETSE